MKTEALPQTNNIKTLVTLEDKIDIERKGPAECAGYAVCSVCLLREW